jgi:hypothetical protein
MTWDQWLYFPFKGRRAEDFFAPKNPTALAGFEPANLGTKGQHATPRTPKLILSHTYMNFTSINFAQTSPKNFGLHSSLLVLEIVDSLIVKFSLVHTIKA